MQHLGYDDAGSHPEVRRLVFVGDLTDRSPDSPAVIDLVQSLIEAGRALCVLGNHDFNILIDHNKPENKWFYSEEFLAKDGSVVPQVLADDSIRHRVRVFFRTLPIALERDDLRVVHACWDTEMIGIARDATNATSLYDMARFAARFRRCRPGQRYGTPGVGKGFYIMECTRGFWLAGTNTCSPGSQLRDGDETTTPAITPTLMLRPPSARPGGPGSRLRSAARVRELAQETRRSP